LKNNHAVADSGKWQVTPWMKDGIEGEGGCDEDHGHDDDHEGQGGQSYKTFYLRHRCSNLFVCEKEQQALKNVNQMFEYQHFHLL
jgi:hypothetical protein